MRDAVEGGKHWSGELQNKRKNGELYWEQTTITPVRDESGVVTNYIAITQDITGRKQAEEDLKTTNQRLFDIIEFLPDATCVIDDEKKVVAWNRACVEMTGVAKEDIIGKGDFVYGIPFYGERRPTLVDHVTMDSDELETRYESIRRVGDQLYGEVFAPVLNNGAGAFLSCIAAPLFDKTGRMVGAIESLRDITEIKAS